MSTLKSKFISAPVNGATVEPLVLQTNDLERVRVDSSGNVGIGTSSPTGIGSSYRSLVIVGSAGGALDLSDSSATTRATICTDNTVGNALFIDTRTSSPIVFRTGAGTTERMRIASDGVITSGLGGMQVISGTAVSASTTAVQFTGIPSWVKKITFLFNGVSTSGTSNWLVQIGGGGSFAVAGYASSSSSGSTTVASTTSTAGFIIRANAAADLLHGAMQVFNVSGNVWAANHTIAPTAGAFYIGAGSTNIGVQLDRIRITTVNGTDTFDAGTINILYE